MGISAQSSIRYTSSSIAEKVAALIDDEVSMAIGDGYDGQLFFTHSIEYNDGDVEIHVAVYQEFPDDLPDDTDIICIDINEARNMIKGMA